MKVVIINGGIAVIAYSKRIPVGPEARSKKGESEMGVGFF